MIIDHSCEAGIVGNDTINYTLSRTEGENADEYVITVTLGNNPNYEVTATDACFTVRKADSVPATVTANEILCDGKEKVLVTVTGETTGGELQLALGEDAETAPADGWSTSIPAATNAGIYYVWYQVCVDENHNDAAPVCVKVTIIPDYTITSVTGLSGASEIQWTKGSDEEVVFTVKISGEDNSYECFAGVKLDGRLLVRDVDYTAKKGSTIVTLSPEVLESAFEGYHTMTVLFENGDVDMVLCILGDGDNPYTGDASAFVLWTVLICLSLAGATVTILYFKKKKASDQ